jgi:hypothetical protein
VKGPWMLAMIFPPARVCSIHVCGIRSTPQVAMIRSNGARCGTPAVPSPATRWGSR